MAITKSKSQSYVTEITWGSSVSPSITTSSNPVKTIWQGSSTSSFTLTVDHSSDSTTQSFTGKKITVTLCDGTYTFQSED